MLAAGDGNTTVIRPCSRQEPTPTPQPEGETVLMTAARTASADAVAHLLIRGAAVNAKETWRGQSALMWAVAERHPDVVRVLLDAGADISARSAKGFTPRFCSRCAPVTSIS